MVTFPTSTPAAAPSRAAVVAFLWKVTAYPVAFEQAADLERSAPVANRTGIAAPTPA